MYKYSCSTYDVLLWESEQTPKPYPHLITITPEIGDLAWVDETKQVYVFNGQWEIKENEQNNKN